MTARTSFTRRGFLAAGTATAALSMAPRHARAQSKELVVGHWGGAGPKTLRSAIVPDFEAKFSGAKVFIREGGDLDRKAMLEANPTNPEIDVYYLSGIDAKLLAERGLTDSLDTKLVPVLDDIYPVAKDGAYGVYLHALTMIYNPEKAQPTSWFDLWRPEFKGRVCLPNTKTIVNQAFVAATVRAMGGKETSKKDVEEARKKILELKPNIVVYHTGTSQALTVMKSGDAWLGMAVAGYTYQAKDAGQSVDVAYPKEGAVAGIDAIAIAKHSKNKELAYGWLNMALAPKAQGAFAQDIYWGPTNSKVPLPDNIKSRVVAGEESIRKLISPDWSYIVEQRPEWVDWWDKNMV